MVSRIEKQARHDKKERLEKMLEEYMTLEEFAGYIQRSRSRVYELAVKQSAIPVLPFSDGGKDSPKWLVKRSDVESFARKPRYAGRPRTGDREQRLTFSI